MKVGKQAALIASVVLVFCSQMGAANASGAVRTERYVVVDQQPNNRVAEVMLGAALGGLVVYGLAQHDGYHHYKQPRYYGRPHVYHKPYWRPANRFGSWGHPAHRTHKDYRHHDRHHGDHGRHGRHDSHSRNAGRH